MTSRAASQVQLGDTIAMDGEDGEVNANYVPMHTRTRSGATCNQIACVQQYQQTVRVAWYRLPIAGRRL